MVVELVGNEIIVDKVLSVNVVAARIWPSLTSGSRPEVRGSTHERYYVHLKNVRLARYPYTRTIRLCGFFAHGLHFIICKMINETLSCQLSFLALLC